MRNWTLVLIKREEDGRTKVRPFFFFSCYVFTYLSTYPTHSVGTIFRCTFLPTSLLIQRPPVAPSFVARRKIGEKGVPKGSKAALWNLAFLLGLEGRRAYFSTNSPKCILRDLGPSGGVRPTEVPLGYGEHTVSTDSVVLHELRRKRWHSKNNQCGSSFAVGWLRKSFNHSGKRSRHEGAGISEAPPLIKIRAGHQCECVWNRYGKWGPY